MPENEPNRKVFLSHSHADEAFVLALKAALVEAGEDVWIDQEDIARGEVWHDSLEAGLRASKAVIVVLSPASIESSNVIDEIDLARDIQLKIIPLMFRECEAPFRIRNIQWIDEFLEATGDDPASDEPFQQGFFKLDKTLKDYWQACERPPSEDEPTAELEVDAPQEEESDAEEPSAEPPVQPKLFMCYSAESQADKDSARDLAELLQAHDFDVWLDQEEVVGGKIRDDEIERALVRSKGVIVLLSPTAKEDPEVRSQFNYALQKRKGVLPVTIEACEVPAKLQILQPIDLSDPETRAAEEQRMFRALETIDVLTEDGDPGEGEVLIPWWSPRRLRGVMSQRVVASTGWIVAGVVAMAFILHLYFRHPVLAATHIVPKGVVGLTVKEARRALEAVGFDVEVPEGAADFMIVSEAPEEASLGSTVRLVVRELVEVPHFEEGDSLRRVLEQLEESGLDFDVLHPVFELRDLEGNPLAPGESIPARTTRVRPTLGVMVPEMKRQSTSVAESAIAEVGLSVAEASYKFDPRFRHGAVIESHPPEGTFLAPSEPVNLVVNDISLLRGQWQPQDAGGPVHKFCVELTPDERMLDILLCDGTTSPGRIDVDDVQVGAPFPFADYRIQIVSENRITLDRDGAEAPFTLIKSEL